MMETVRPSEYHVVKKIKWYKCHVAVDAGDQKEGEENGDCVQTRLRPVPKIKSGL